MNSNVAVWAAPVLKVVFPFLEQCKARAQGRLPRRLFTAAGFLILLTGVVFSLSALPDGELIRDGRFLLLIGGIGVPLLILTNAWETRLSASLIGGHFTWAQALRISTLASAANLLPLPGGAMVRIASLTKGGARLGDASAVTVALALAWLGLSFLWPGGWLTAAGYYWISLPFLAVGAVASAASMFWLTRISKSRTGIAEVVILKAVTVAASMIRMAWALAALGVVADTTALSVFAVSSVSGAAVSIIPAGLGVNEMVAAAVATVVAIPPTTAFLAAAIMRAINLALQTILALVLTVTADRG